MASPKHVKSKIHAKKRRLSFVIKNPFMFGVLVLGILFILFCAFFYAFGYVNGQKAQKANDDIAFEAIVQEAEERYNNMVAEYEARLNTPTEEVNTYNAEAEYIAKLLYGQARYNSPEAQKAIAWLIINRVESPYYPNSVQEVVEQQSQWMGYNDNNIIEDRLYEVALTAVNDWHNGAHRPFSADFLYMVWTSDEITLRTTFEETRGTQYLTVK